jgi:hypothetical protein
MNENEISNRGIGVANKVHQALAPGLLINFNVVQLRDGIRRVVNNY